MIKKTLAASGIVLAGALTFVSLAKSDPLSYSANFCSQAYTSNNSDVAKGSSYYVGGSWQDIVCPFVLSGTADARYTKLRYRSASTSPGGYCSAITLSPYGSSVGYVNVNLTTSNGANMVADFGTVEASAANAGYIACYVPPGTSLYNYFVNQPW